MGRRELLPCKHTRDANVAGCAWCRIYREDDRYRAMFDGEEIPPRPAGQRKPAVHVVRRDASPRSGQAPSPPRRRAGARPGDKLKAMLAAIGIKGTADCDCEKWVNLMNRWGVEGCKANRSAIIMHLQNESAKMAGFQGDPSELDWGPMVDEAIRQAEAEGGQ